MRGGRRAGSGRKKGVESKNMTLHISYENWKKTLRLRDAGVVLSHLYTEALEARYAKLFGEIE